MTKTLVLRRMALLASASLFALAITAVPLTFDGWSAAMAQEPGTSDEPGGGEEPGGGGGGGGGPKGNNGFGNGSNDGSPNGMDDTTR